MAIRNPQAPTRPISMLMVAPSRPAMTPSERPKLSPQPDWIIGTSARTMIPFMPMRIRVSEIDAGRLTSTKGAARNRANR